MNSSTPSTGTPSTRIVDGGSPAPTFWSFIFGHDNLKPSIAAKALIGGHCLLGADEKIRIVASSA